MVVATEAWVDQIRTWAPAIAALGTLLAAVAAWRSANTSARASRLSEQAALAAMLGVIPLPHPSVTLNGTADIKNRGTTEAVNINWRIVHEGDEDQVVVKGSLPKVLPAQASRSILDPPSADLTKSLAERRHIFICDYQTTWGEQFTVRRILRRANSGKRVNADVTVVDANGRTMRLSSQ